MRITPTFDRVIVRWLKQDTITQNGTTFHVRRRGRQRYDRKVSLLRGRTTSTEQYFKLSIDSWGHNEEVYLDADELGALERWAGWAARELRRENAKETP